MRRRTTPLRWLGVTALVGVMATALVSGQTPANAAAHGQVTTVPLAPARAALPIRPAIQIGTPVKVTGTGSCPSLMTKLHSLALAGHRTAVCTRVTKSQPTPSGTMKPAAAFPNPQDQCAYYAVTNAWFYGRSFICALLNPVTAETIDTGTGAVLGTAIYIVEHAIGLDSTSPNFSNFTSFNLLSESGAEPPNSVYSTNECDVCTGFVTLGHPFATLTTLTPGNSVYGSDDMGDGPLAGDVLTGRYVTWTDEYVSPGAAPDNIQVNSSPVPFRCDAQANVNGTTAGCVVSEYTPQLLLPGFYDGSNAATAGVVAFAGDNVDHWGYYNTGKPLTRLSNSSQASKNRYAMCQNGTWKANPTVATDSCDEYAFAATYQSGNLLGLKATSCTQWIPIWHANTASWSISAYPGYTAAQRCLLQHVALAGNNLDGTYYGNFIKSNRLLNADPFWIGAIPAR